MFHILRFSDLSVLEMAPLRFSLPYIVSVLVNKQTSVNRFSYLFHIHTAVLLYRHTCTNAVIPLLAIVLVVTYQGTALLLLLFVVFCCCFCRRRRFQVRLQCPAYDEASFHHPPPLQ